jgi:hypothetical protein
VRRGERREERIENRDWRGDVPVGGTVRWKRREARGKGQEAGCKMQDAGNKKQEAESER